MTIARFPYHVRVRSKDVLTRSRLESPPLKLKGKFDIIDDKGTGDFLVECELEDDRDTLEGLSLLDIIDD